MTDSSFLSVNFGNMDQLVTELTSIVNQAQTNTADLISQLNNTLGSANNWGGLGQTQWSAVQLNWNKTMENMNQVINAARLVTTESASQWPAIEQSIAGLFST
jgi:uncharacterized protein YukE